MSTARGVTVKLTAVTLYVPVPEVVMVPVYMPGAKLPGFTEAVTTPGVTPVGLASVNQGPPDPVLAVLV